MGLVQMKSGKITATATEASDGKNVDCGFIPELVIIFNEDVADGEDGLLIRFGGMAAAQSAKIVRLDNDGGGDNVNLVDETTNGLSDYNTGSTAAASSTLTGTSTSTAGSATLAGTGGAVYSTELSVGDIIEVGSEKRRVTAIASNSSLTVDSAFRVAAADTSATKFAAGALVTRSGFKGFTIPSNFITATSDVLHFAAFGTQFEA